METIKDIWYAPIKAHGEIDSVYATREEAEKEDNFGVERVSVTIDRIKS